jgi:hypothetical protein
MLLLGLTLSAAAQEETPEFEVFAGYSFAKMSLSDGVLPSNVHAGLNGWNAEFGWNVNNWLGITGDFSGYYGGPNALVLFKPADCVLCTESATRKLRGEYNFLFGPKVSRHSAKATVFGHVLLGRAQYSESESGAPLVGDPAFPPPPTSGSSLAMALGGGLDVELGRKSVLRFQSDYLLTRFSGATQHNFRISTGPVFRFGS